MSASKSKDNQRTIIEPFSIKGVEPLSLHTRNDRKRFLQATDQVTFGKFSPNSEFVAAAIDLVRLGFPRRVYTQSHCDCVLEGMADIVARKDIPRGMMLVYEHPCLRHFTGLC